MTAEHKYDKDVYDTAIAGVNTAMEALNILTTKFSELSFTVDQNIVDTKYEEQVEKVKMMVPIIRELMEKTKMILVSYDDSKEAQEIESIHKFGGKKNVEPY